MSLNAALVDQARVLTATRSMVRVRGESQFELLPSAWFKCRLTLPAAQASVDAQSFRRRSSVVPSLLYGIRDTDGNPVFLTIETRVEVLSPQLGRLVWDVVSSPEPLRKKRRVIGFQTTLRRVLDEELPDAEAV